MANPTLLTMPLCVNADKNTIPPTDAGTSGLFSEEYGWQNINSLPLASGGKAPNRRDFNGAFALLGGIAYACQRGYTFTWDATQDYEVGCIVIDSTDGKKYECVSDVTANATPPSADSTHWKLATDIAWFIRQPSTAYALGTVVYLPSIGAGLYLECTTAGTTDSGDLAISTPTPNSTVSDGTVVWTICKSANTQDLANYLPLSGGQLRGSFPTIDQNNDTGAILIMAGQRSASPGAYLQLNGRKRSGKPGTFTLLAQGDSSYKILQGNPDGTLTWDGANVLTDASGILPIGALVNYAGNGAIPSHYLLCDGSAVSRTTYAKLFAVIGTTYGTGNGSTTFNLPNFVDKFAQGSATAGTVKSAGLPNIKGTFTAVNDDLSNGTNTLIASKTDVHTDYCQSTSSSQRFYAMQYKIDASLASNIYSDSVTTVQPPALTCRVLIKYE